MQPTNYPPLLKGLFTSHTPRNRNGTGPPWDGNGLQRDWYFIAEQPAPAPHHAQLERFAALRIVRVTVPRVSRSCEHFPDGFDLQLLQMANNANTDP